MKINFCGEVENLAEGISILSKELGYEISEDGMLIKAEKHSLDTLEVISSRGEKVIRYNERIHFFRALGLFMEAFKEKGEFHIIEHPQFATNGVMFDVSQGNAVPNVDNVKNILIKMSVMGLNMLMLYAEDSYEIKGEPYFGYMRSKYGNDELRELDHYAYALGIEIIPCIQTLAHLIDVLKWECYWSIRDDDDTLLVGNDKAYEFIEKMIVSASLPFRSRRIHIGMDEAWKLGQGSYLLENGYRRKFDIMNEHLDRVMKIINKHGLKPIIWSDMYFRAASESGDYYDRNSTIPRDVIDKVPQGVQLVYWDYEHHTEEAYVDLIKKHKEFGTVPLFAGGIWNWNSYAVDYDKTFAATNPALMACKNEGIREVFATIWGDGGCESNIYSNLLGMQLFAEHGYSRELDTEKLKKRFKYCTGGNYEDFYRITYLDKLPDMPAEEGWKYTNPSKYLMWQDLLAGLFDKNIEGLNMGTHYESVRKAMENAADTNGELNFMFVFLEKVCSVLSLKSDMGLKITEAYKNREQEVLASVINRDLPELLRRVEDLRLYHQDIWMKINKPLGWEVMDIRYGGVLTRIKTTIKRISGYLDGEVPVLDELEQERLYFLEKPGLVPCCIYSRICSASRLSFSYGY